MKMEIQLLLPWSEARRKANEVWNTKGFRDQILSDGCKVRYYRNGDKFWYNQNDQLHRLDGPAVEYSSGYKSWYQNGQYHRLDGPAIEYPSGTKYWYIKDEKYTEKEFNAQRQKDSDS